MSAFLLLAFSCTPSTVGPNRLTAQDRDNQTLAIQNSMCAFENQERCSHVIENRVLLGRFFAPDTLGGIKEEEKARGRRITTKFVVEAAASIQQCRKVVEDSVALLRGIQIKGQAWQLKATTPVNLSSACFITPDNEASS